MQSLMDKALMGYVELQVGSLKVEIPIRAAGEASPAEPAAKFEMEGDACAIVVRGDATSKQVERAMQRAAREAVRQLSRKLLN
ncbi:hypothetical protein GF068_23940 [Polyangium spumosum]|uniref:Uncharacterized protein n=2 Tax=Polyangium spumosum TaxID=889282 RepID=A0A6N7PSC5_9BACT|nr:hypothetical protein [Polyangium spumosum]